MFPDPYSLELDPDRPTWPPPGTSTLTITDLYEPLFTSATWTITARVNGEVMVQSRPSDKPHSPSFVKRWARQFIRTRYVSLRRQGVDADNEYVKWGGSLADLVP